MLKFLVGAEQILMMIHTALVAELSPALESLVDGSMQEAISGTIIWEDLEEDTFEDLPSLYLCICLGL